MARLTGHLGSVYIKSGGGSLAVVADVYDWTMEMTVEAAPCPIKGEKPDTYSIGGTSTKITCQRYTTSASAFALLAAAAGAAGGTATPNLASGAIVGFTLRGLDSATGAFTVDGEGIVTRGNMSANHAQLLNDTLEITCYTIPTVN